MASESAHEMKHKAGHIALLVTNFVGCKIHTFGWEVMRRPKILFSHLMRFFPGLLFDATITCYQCHVSAKIPAMGLSLTLWQTNTTLGFRLASEHQIMLPLLLFRILVSKFTGIYRMWRSLIRSWHLYLCKQIIPPCSALRLGWCQNYQFKWRC